MKITIISNNGLDQQVDIFENVVMIEFENQEHLGNGQWIHIFKKDEEFSTSFDPKTEWYRIEEK